MTVAQDPSRIEAANYQSYMRGWKNGACVNAMDPDVTSREPSDPIRKHYEIGYLDGRKSRNAAANIATNLTGHVPSVLRLASVPRHVFFDGNRSEAWAKLHHVASDPDIGTLLIIGEPFHVADEALHSAPRDATMTHRPASATLTWPNGVVARIVSPRNMDAVRGMSVAFALVVDWPNESDWAHVEMAVRAGHAQIVAIDRPPASWSHVPGSRTP